MTNPSVAIFDLDGTLCNITHRLHKIRPSKEFSILPMHPPVSSQPDDWKADWDGFYELCDQDQPFPNIIKLAQALSRHYHIIIISGRSEIVVDKTKAWLKQHVVPYNQLAMRLKDDFRPDHELKLDALGLLGLTPADILCVVEDRARVVKMWRDLGITCLQCSEGDY